MEVNTVMRKCRLAANLMCVVVCLLCVVLWVRSYFASDSLCFLWSDEAALRMRETLVHANRGRIVITKRYLNFDTLEALQFTADALGHLGDYRGYSDEPPGLSYHHGKVFENEPHPSSVLGRLGIWMHNDTFEYKVPIARLVPTTQKLGTMSSTSVEATFPIWLALVIFLPLPVVSLYRGQRRRRLSRIGKCAKCGYDLRASVGRCPECGTAIVPLAGLKGKES
jgi:hypothetical protein